MFTICKRFDFSAAHRLDKLPETHPCFNLHGHNYEVWIEFSAEEPDERGFVIDYRDLGAIKKWIDGTLDHRHLNDVLPWTPTAENIALFIFERVPYLLDATAFPVTLAAVRVSETQKTWAEYRP